MAIKKKAAKKAAPKKGGNVTKSGAHNNPTKTSTRAVTVTMSGPRVTKKVVRNNLKEKGLKLPHGYEVKRRSITGIMNEGKKLILKDIGVLESQKFAASSKREKNKLTKSISLLKRSYKKLT